MRARARIGGRRRGSPVARVELRRDDALHLNDGIYGGLSDLTFGGIVVPMRLIRQDGEPAVGSSSRLRPFRLFGPSCDSADRIAGPFLLDDAVSEGDWIEIGQAGAYSNVLATCFNGFRSNRSVVVRDDAFLPAPPRQIDQVPRCAAE